MEWTWEATPPGHWWTTSSGRRDSTSVLDCSSSTALIPRCLAFRNAQLPITPQSSPATVFRKTTLTVRSPILEVSWSTAGIDRMVTLSFCWPKSPSRPTTNPTATVTPVPTPTQSTVAPSSTPPLKVDFLGLELSSGGAEVGLYVTFALLLISMLAIIVIVWRLQKIRKTMKGATSEWQRRSEKENKPLQQWIRF